MLARGQEARTPVALHTLVKRSAKNSKVITDLIRSTVTQGRRSVSPLLPGGWLRVSSIGKMCPREEVLCSRGQVVREDNISSDLGMVFEIGHAIHWLMQNRIMAPTGLLLGRWRCTWCGEVYGSYEEGLALRPESCLRCGAVAEDPPRVEGRPDPSVRGEAFLYVEQWIGNHDYLIGGHPDGFMVDGDPADFTDDDVVLLEFKSASSRSYYAYKKSPDFMHVIQCQVYMWLTGYRRAKVIYIDKGTYGMAAIAQHDLDYDPEIVERVKEAIEGVHKGIEGGLIPERSMCADIDCQRAQGCAVSDTCFAGE